MARTEELREKRSAHVQGFGGEWSQPGSNRRPPACKAPGGSEGRSAGGAVFPMAMRDRACSVQFGEVVGLAGFRALGHVVDTAAPH
jgi:hypothetical protein